MAIDPSELEQVFHDNQRSHQIGGQTDGITPEVASDLGFSTAEEAAQLARDLPEPLHEVTRAALESSGIEAPRRKLTSAQQNVNEARYIAEHRRRVPKQILDRRYP